MIDPLEESMIWTDASSRFRLQVKGELVKTENSYEGKINDSHQTMVRINRADGTYTLKKFYGQIGGTTRQENA